MCYTGKVRDETLHKLGERVKELTALHKTARLLQDSERPAEDVVRDVVNLLPGAWQYPEVAVARIQFGKVDAATSDFRETPWLQAARFKVDDDCGRIEVGYLAERPDEAEGPFLSEERDLIESLAEMLRSYFQHVQADEALRQAHQRLERQVQERTAALSASNEALRKLNSELALVEARERRAISSDLHDHIGQALAFVRMRVSEFRGNAVFCGFEDSIDEILTLLDKTIQYTRSLTFEISPPVLYELGLIPAIEWLGERFESQHGLRVKTSVKGETARIGETAQIVLFKCVHELLTNIVKHAQARQATIAIEQGNGVVRLTVSDNGRGFDTAELERTANDVHTFGLFSVRERMKYLGGRFEILSSPGRGTTATLEAQL